MISIDSFESDKVWDRIWNTFWIWSVAYGSLAFIFWGISGLLAIWWRKNIAFTKSANSTEIFRRHSGSFSAKVELSWREKIIVKILQRWRGLLDKSSRKYVRHRNMFNGLQFVFSLVICAVEFSSLVLLTQFSVEDDQIPSVPLWIMITRSVSLVFFLIDFFFRASIFPKPIPYYMTSLISIVDSLSIAFLASMLNYWICLGFLRAFVLMHTLKASKATWRALLGLSDIDVQILIICMEIIVLIFAFSILIFIVENLGNPPFIGQNYNLEEFNLFNSIYFSFIAISTVGFGDIVVSTVIGRVFVIFFIIWGIVLFSQNLNELLRYTKESSLGLGRFAQSVGEEFVILTGEEILFETTKSVSFLMQSQKQETEKVKSCREITLSGALSAVFSRQQTKVVVLSKSVDPNISDFLEYYKNLQEEMPLFASTIFAMDGSPLDAKDLNRASANEASCIFIVSNPLSHDSEGNDVGNAFCLRSIFSQVPKVGMFISFAHAGNEILLPTEVSALEKRSMTTSMICAEFFAISCFAKGFCRFMYELTGSFEKYPTYEGKREQEQSTPRTKIENIRMGNPQFYVVMAYRKFSNSNLIDIVRTAYDQWGIFVITGLSRVLKRTTTFNDPVRCNAKIQANLIADPFAKISFGDLLVVISNEESLTINLGYRVSYFKESKEFLLETLKYDQQQKYPLIHSNIELSNVKEINQHPDIQFVASSPSQSTIERESANLEMGRYCESIPSPPKEIQNHLVFFCVKRSISIMRRFLRYFRRNEIKQKRHSKGYNSDDLKQIVICSEENVDMNFLRETIPLERLHNIFFQLSPKKLKNMTDFQSLQLEKAETVRIID